MEELKPVQVFGDQVFYDGDFSFDERFLAVATSREIFVYSLEGGTLLLRRIIVPKIEERISKIKFLQESHTLVAGVGRFLAFWEGLNFDWENYFVVSDSPIETMDFSKGKRVILGDEKGKIVVLDLKRKEVLFEFETKDYLIGSIFSPKEKDIIAFGTGKEIYISRLGGKKEVIARLSWDRDFYFTSFDFSPLGEVLMIGASFLSLFERHSKLIFWNFKEEEKKEIDFVGKEIKSVRFSSQDEIFLAIGREIVHFSKKKKRWKFSPQISQIERLIFSPSGNYLLCLNEVSGTSLYFLSRH